MITSKPFCFPELPWKEGEEPARGTAEAHRTPGRAAGATQGKAHAATQPPEGELKGGPVCQLLARMEAGETPRGSVASVLEAEKHV